MFAEFVEADLVEFSFPLVIKPVNEAHGNGVMMHILSYSQLQEKLTTSFEIYATMIVQEQIQGNEYRMLVVKGEILAGLYRIPAAVTGDGIHTIQQLIEKENEEHPHRGEGYEKALSYIPIDDEMCAYIHKHGTALTDIPNKGLYIQLRGNSNIGTGGLLVNVTHDLCEEIKNICIEVSSLLGLAICGVDIITTDIRRPFTDTGGIILELNANPGLGGDKELLGIHTGKRILEKLFFEE